MAYEYDILQSIRRILNALAADIRKDKWDDEKNSLDKALELCGGLEKKEFAKILKQYITTIKDTLELHNKLISFDHIDTTLKFMTSAKNVPDKDLIKEQFNLMKEQFL